MERILHKIRPKKILVAGEIMLDVYYKGSVKRISPEAPVPVFLKEKITYRLGGKYSRKPCCKSDGCLPFVCYRNG